MKEPLVSIIVVTYNSSKYVLETLESAKAQIYKNIELIISDDCSTDNTVAICKKWLKENKSSFVRIELISSKKNRGIAPNCNQGLYKSRGKWIKFIAGDDLLLSNCIQTNIQFAINSKSSFFFSQMKFTKSSENLENIFDKGFELLNNNKNQLKILLKGNCLPAPTAFIRRTTIIKLKGFDERFPMVEDFPCWINALKNNFKIETISEPTVIYRINEDGVSQNKNKVDDQKFYNGFKFEKSCFSFTQKVIIVEQLKNLMFLRSLNSLIAVLQYKVSMNIFDNKKNFVSKFVFNTLSICKPSLYYNLFKK